MEKGDPFHRSPHVLVRSGRAFWATLGPSVRFLMETEVHVYSFAVAANLLMTFFPFLVVMTALCRWGLHWQAAVDVILHTVKSYFPPGFGVPFDGYLLQATTHRKFSWISVLLLFVTANGIFEPLEVAFNRIWRVKENRSFLWNQITGLGLVFLCGALFLASTSITALNVEFLTSRFGTNSFTAVVQLIMFKVIALPITVLNIFLIYWLLPNVKIAVKRLAIASIFVGVFLQVLQYVNVLTWPWLRAKLENEVPPFVQSISIILWAFAAAMVILAGAEWSARVTVVELEEAVEKSPA